MHANSVARAAAADAAERTSDPSAATRRCKESMRHWNRSQLESIELASATSAAVRRCKQRQESLGRRWHEEVVSESRSHELPGWSGRCRHIDGGGSKRMGKGVTWGHAGTTCSEGDCSKEREGQGEGDGVKALNTGKDAQKHQDVPWHAGGSTTAGTPTRASESSDEHEVRRSHSLLVGSAVRHTQDAGGGKPGIGHELQLAPFWPHCISCPCHFTAEPLEVVVSKKAYQLYTHPDVFVCF